MKAREEPGKSPGDSQPKPLGEGRYDDANKKEFGDCYFAKKQPESIVLMPESRFKITMCQEKSCLRVESEYQQSFIERVSMLFREWMTASWRNMIPIRRAAATLKWNGRVKVKINGRTKPVPGLDADENINMQRKLISGYWKMANSGRLYKENRNSWKKNDNGVRAIPIMTSQTVEITSRVIQDQLWNRARKIQPV